MTESDFKGIFNRNCEFFDFSENFKGELCNNIFPLLKIAFDGNPVIAFENFYLYSRYNPLSRIDFSDIEKKEVIFIIENCSALSLYALANNYNQIFRGLKEKIVIFTSFFTFFFSLFLIDWSVLSFNNTKLLMFDSNYDSFTEDFKKNLEKIQITSSKNGLEISISTDLNLFIQAVSQSFEEILINYGMQKIKLHIETSPSQYKTKNFFSVRIASNKFEFFQSDHLLFLVESIKAITERQLKSDLTEQYFERLWQSNIKRNVNLVNERAWMVENFNAFAHILMEKDLILWGASKSVLDFMEKLDDKMRKNISHNYLSISIPSTVNLLRSYGVDPSFQIFFDAGLFGYYQIEDFDLPLITSFIVHPAILRSLRQNPIFVSLDTEQERTILTKFFLPVFPFYGATLTTFYKGLISKNASQIYKNTIFLIGSGFNSDEKPTHHRFYPLYRYVMNKSDYFKTLQNYETKLYIENRNKFPIYKKSLKSLPVKDEVDLYYRISQG
ncbi:MAG TPA: hypothetical protein PK520_02045 [Exilispira sp.]|nr:hypothetical protein [Exilispira sp.]